MYLMNEKKRTFRMLAGCVVLLAIGAGVLPGQVPVACVTTPASVPCNLGTGQAPPGTVNTASDPIWNIVPNIDKTLAPTGNTSGPAVPIGSPIWTLPIPTGLHWIAT